MLDNDPNEREHMTTHEAQPVEAGVKYGANGKFRCASKVEFGSLDKIFPFEF